MASVIFRGAFIRHADLRWEGEAGKFVRLHITADFSDPVREQMGWEELSGTIDSAKLSGELAARNMILTPNGKELARHELDLAILSVDDFQVFRIKNEDGDSTRTELRFVIRTNEKTAAAWVEKYVEAIGRGLGKLKIAYPKQDELDLQPTEEKPADAPEEEADPEEGAAGEQDPGELIPVPEPRRRGRPGRNRGPSNEADRA